MNILITGANGFLGKYICTILGNNHKVYTLGRKLSDIYCDLRTDIPVLPNVYFDLVIHAAGKAHDNSLSDEIIQEIKDVNIRGTENLIKGFDSLSHYPKYFVFISSVSVYGLDEGQDVNEEMPLNAKDAYGNSKIFAEKFLASWCLHHRITFTSLRLPLVVGKMPPGNLGNMIKAINNNYYFNINKGKAKRSMVYADDVAKIIESASKIGGIYNLTDGYHPSFNELSSEIALQLGKRKVINLPLWMAKFLAKVGDFMGATFPINSIKLNKLSKDLTFDDTKARNILDWKSQNVLTVIKNVVP